MSKKTRRFATTTIICVLVASIFGSVIVFAPPSDPLLPAYIEVFVVNTDPVPVALDGPIEVTLDDPIDVTLDEPIEVTVTDGVTLAEDSEVKTIAKTKVFIAFDHVELDAAPSASAPSYSVVYLDVDGYKTVNVWTRGINGITTVHLADWAFEAAGEVFAGPAADYSDPWEGQETHEVRAPTLRISISNYDTSPSQPITVVVYAIS